jgi:outer membrane protein TolC
MALIMGCASRYERYGTISSGTVIDSPIEAESYRAKERENLPELGEESTLEDYLVYAALHNPGLEASFNRWKSAAERIPQAGALPDPRLHFSYSDMRREGGVSQMFPWFGKRSLDRNGAAETAKAQYEEFQAEKLKIFYEIKESYFEYYYLGREIAVTEENLKLLQYMEQVARTKYESGQENQQAVIKIQVETGNLEDRLLTLRDSARPLVAKTNAALGRPSDAPILWPKEISNESIDLSSEEFRAVLGQNSPELRAKSLLAETERISIERSRKEYYPDVEIGVSWMNEEMMTMSGPERKDLATGMISISLPLWRSKYGAGVREAETRHEAAVKEREDSENRLTSDLAMALYEYRDSERKIDLYKNTLIPKARQSLDVSNEAFISGKASSLDVIDAERVLLDFQLSYERALVDRAIRIAEIEMLVGTEIPRVRK